MELWITLGVLGTLIIGFLIYGYRSGGVEAMLERERAFNTIDAKQRYTIKELIDFFGQIKRVDSLYVKGQTAQLKTNNRLSEPFSLTEIERWVVMVGETTVLNHATSSLQFDATPLQDCIEKLDPTHPDAFDPRAEVECQWVLTKETHYLRFDDNQRMADVLHKVWVTLVDSPH